MKPDGEIVKVCLLCQRNAVGEDVERRRDSIILEKQPLNKITGQN